MITKPNNEFAQWVENISGPMAIDDNTGLPLEGLKPYFYSLYKGLQRFIDIQNKHNNYQIALSEIENGKKKTHWMWYIFPQMKGLGKSETSIFYGINGREEAKAYIEHPLLGKRLLKVTEAVLNNEKTPYEIFGNDVIKFRSCMLLFASISNNSIFKKVINKYNWV